MVQNYSVVAKTGPPVDNCIALTFDAGSSQGYVNEILEILDERDCVATFFITGIWAEGKEDTVEKVKKQGHEIGNHTYNHPCLVHLTQEEIRGEVEELVSLIRKINHTAPAIIIRPPYGEYNRSVLEALDQSGYPETVLWTVDTSTINPKTDDQWNQVWRRVFQGGNIIRFTLTDKKNLTILPKLIDQGIRHGFSFLKVSHLLKKDCTLQGLRTEIVLPGETLTDLVARTGINPQVITLINRLPMNSNPLPHQKVYLPIDPHYQPYVYTTLPGDNINTILAKFNIDSYQLAYLNGPFVLERLIPGQPILIPKDNSLTYTVQVGDDLHKISHDLAISLSKLIKMNPDLTHPGQILRIDD